MGEVELKLQDKVLSYIHKYELFYPGEKVVVAVSGGPDSVCLLHLLNSIKHQLGIHLCAAHLDHKLRGEASKQDTQYVAGLAKRLKVKAIVASGDVATYRMQKKLSLEEAAREIRYEFFARVVDNQEAGCVAIAHSRNDNIETIMLHILRGTGISGLQGLQPHTVLQIGGEKRALNVVRPLLEVSRPEIDGYCRKFRLRPRYDESNSSVTFRRNRIRHELLPVLESYNPRIDEALLRLANIAHEQMEYLNEQTAHAWSEIVEAFEGFLSLDSRKMAQLPGILQRQLLRWSAKYLCGDLRDIESEHIEEMLKFLHKPAGKVLHLPRFLRLQKEHGHLILRLEGRDLCPFPILKDEYSIKVPGETTLPGWLIKTEILAAKGHTYDSGGFVASFDFARTGRQLKLRPRRPGDVFHPLGMPQSKKLHHFMSDAAIPRLWRDNLPLVCAEGNIIWVAGWRIAEPYKITLATLKILRISLHRIL